MSHVTLTIHELKTKPLFRKSTAPLVLVKFLPQDPLKEHSLSSLLITSLWQPSATVTYLTG